MMAVLKRDHADKQISNKPIRYLDSNGFQYRKKWVHGETCELNDRFWGWKPQTVANVWVKELYSLSTNDGLC
jgi:hypothetical protein